MVRIDCSSYCTFEILDYVLGVVLARFKERVVSTTATQLWVIELGSDSGCEALKDMNYSAQSEMVFGTLWEERYYVGGLRTRSHMMVIQHC